MIKKNGIFLMTLLFILSVISANGQERQDKTFAIIKELNLVEDFKIDIINYKLKPLKYQATGNDSIKLIKIEKQLTEEEFIKRISNVFNETYTEKEINDTYIYTQTTAFKKFFRSGETYDALYKEFDDINDELDQISKKINKKGKQPLEQFKPIPVDREDGFYATVDYNSSSEYKYVYLEEKPSLTKKDISVVRKAYDDRVYIDLTLTEEGAKKFYILTKNNLTKPIAIVIEKHIVYLPIVNSEITGGKVFLSGDFSEKEIDRMIEILNEK